MLLFHLSNDKLLHPKFLKDMTENMKKALLALFVLLVPVFSVAENVDSLQAERHRNDSLEAHLPTDITVGLLVVEPGNTLYTSYGHCALRLQCPTKGFDVSFTYGLKDSPREIINFLAGTGVGQYYHFNTQDYLNEYRAEGRQVMEYDINLTLDEKRNLWQHLDRQVAEGGFLRYDYVHTNCSSMCIQALSDALIGEHVEYGSLPPAVTGTYRDFIRAISHRQPWTDFVWQTLLGTVGERTGNVEDKLAPSLIIPTWSHARIVTDNGHSRPVIVGQPRLVVKAQVHYRPFPVTPTLCFTLLLIVTLLITWGQWRWGWHKAAYALDATLLTAQTLCGLLVFFTTCLSQWESAHGCLYVLVLNPLPLILWLLFRKHEAFRWVYVAYTVVLLFFIVAPAFMPQVDLPHALIAATLAVRCLSAYAERVRKVG